MHSEYKKIHKKKKCDNASRIKTLAQSPISRSKPVH